MEKKKSFFWDLKPPKSCDLITELVSKLVLTQWNMVISCSSAFYPQTFCLTGIFFFPQQAGNQERILRFSACFQSNSYLSKGPESQTEVLTLTPPVLLRAPGPALTRLLGKWRRKCPLLHPSWFSADSTHWPSGLSSLLCTQLGLGSGNFLQDSALFFFFSSHFCKPGCVKRGEHWPGWDIMLLVHI